MTRVGPTSAEMNDVLDSLIMEKDKENGKEPSKRSKVVVSDSPVMEKNEENDKEPSKKNTILEKIKKLKIVQEKQEKNTDIEHGPDVIELLQNLTKFLIYHDQKAYRIWKIFLLLTICINCILTTFLASVSSRSITVWFVVYIFDLLNLCDIVMHFVLTYTDEIGVRITDRNKLAIQYLRTTFIFDLFSILPIELLAFLPSVSRDYGFERMMAILRMNRIIGLSKVSDVIGEI